MLEIACILSLAVGDYEDFGIIAAMLICNGYLGFHEELKAKASLVPYIIISIYICSSFFFYIF
jgi:hypothetical protein